MALRRRVQRVSEPGPELSPPNESEIEWRDRHLKAGQLIAKRYCGDCGDLPGLEQLDRVGEGWLDDDATRIDVNVLINAVGIANAIAKRVVAQQRQFVGSLHQALTADFGPG